MPTPRVTMRKIRHTLQLATQRQPQSTQNRRCAGYLQINLQRNRQLRPGGWLKIQSALINQLPLGDQTQQTTGVSVNQGVN